MNALRRVGALAAATIVAAASLMWGATPASAAGSTHYANVGNPGWCLDGNGTTAYIHLCGHGTNPGDIDFQLWNFNNDADDLQLVHNASGKCLTVLATGFAELRTCGGLASIWDAVGKNGWVKLVSQANFGCLAPIDTHVPGRSTYRVATVLCDPYDLGNVPNHLAWRYH